MKFDSSSPAQTQSLIHGLFVLVIWFNIDNHSHSTKFLDILNHDNYRLSLFIELFSIPKLSCSGGTRKLCITGSRLFGICDRD